MPLPKPTAKESQAEFVSRCHSLLASEFSDEKQRHAVCVGLWRKARASSVDGDNTACCDSCAHGGTCESATCGVTLKAQTSPSIRTFAATVAEKTIAGEKYVVFPVVMMVEGVRQAANAPAPELLLRPVFERAIKKGMKLPLVYTHPQKGKKYVGVNDDHDATTGIDLGWVQDLKFHGTKLIGIAHMSVKKTQAAGKSAVTQLERIRKKEMVEVSVGHAARVLPVKGSFGGKVFAGIHYDVMFDHLALLRPTDLGACSNEDGCGAPRMNTTAEDAEDTEVKIRGFVVESSKFRQRFILRDSKIVSIGANDPTDLRDADESQFVIVLEDRAKKTVKIVSQRFRRLSEARTVAKEKLLKTKNEDLVAIIGQMVGTAEIDGARKQVFRDVVGLRYRRHKKDDERDDQSKK